MPYEIYESGLENRPVIESRDDISPNYMPPGLWQTIVKKMTGLQDPYTDKLAVQLLTNEMRNLFSPYKEMSPVALTNEMLNQARMKDYDLKAKESPNMFYGQNPDYPGLNAYAVYSPSMGRINIDPKVLEDPNYATGILGHEGIHAVDDVQRGFKSSPKRHMYMWPSDTPEPAIAQYMAAIRARRAKKEINPALLDRYPSLKAENPVFLDLPPQPAKPAIPTNIMWGKNRGR